jgi:hypothetical protein
LELELQKELKHSTDAKMLAVLLQTLHGRSCLKAELSYGDELTLHFGVPLPYSSPKLSDELRGAWILGTRGSKWQIGNEKSRVQSDDYPTEFTLAALPIVGQTVISARVKTITIPAAQELAIQLSNGVHIFVTPTPPDADDGDLPDWELFMPWGMYLAYGPGEQWSYRSSTTPTAR